MIEAIAPHQDKNATSEPNHLNAAGALRSVVRTVHTEPGAQTEHWELTILDPAPPVGDLGSLAAGDLDGDGNVEVVTGGDGAILWYRPATFERGLIHEGRYVVGLALEDIDGDGRLEVIAGKAVPVEGSSPLQQIVWLKPAAPDGRLDGLWTEHVVDGTCSGSIHDLLFADVDGDGRRELLATAAYSIAPAVSIYRPGADLTVPWLRHPIQAHYMEEGLDVADMDGDGRLEIVSGPAVYYAPADGPYAGPWRREVFAPGFRDMVRVAALDVTGSGRPDIVIAESEYPDGRLSWFENRTGPAAGPDGKWIEHRLEHGLNFAHSLGAWRQHEEARFFVAEMGEGGWNAPINREARLLRYASADGGRTWERRVLSQAAGSHQALVCDVDGDGEPEIIGKEWQNPVVQLWKRRDGPPPFAAFAHRFLDRDKPTTGTDIVAVDVDGDGRPDVVCGRWWYHNPTWERHELPEGYQVLNAQDVDGDGRAELIVSRHRDAPAWYGGLTSELYWLEPVDPLRGKWRAHHIGEGHGDWPHGHAVAPLLPGGRLALVAGYHNAAQGVPPELFEVPDDPRTSPWPKRALADVRYGEEIVPCDLDGDGLLDLAAGPYVLWNQGDGTFAAQRIAPEGFQVARVGIADVDGDGHPDIVLGEEVLDFERKVTPLSLLAWFRNPGWRGGEWEMRPIDRVRCPHSVGVADLDGDGEVEVVCGEHDPFKPYRTQCRLLVYKKAGPTSRAWHRHVLDDRFEHHDGAKIVELEPGKPAIISHGWRDSRYVHLWST